ncbi:MAG: ribonucleoside reductase class II, partial [Candidatus Diapherotrites archaeon]|nr:ribonucleoside reductase class II [Candidatus Diapherotrites archaeon]
IYKSLTDAAIIHQSGGGTGFPFSELRPEGDFVKSSFGVASGPISFMKLYDASTNEIKQGGTRRGANMGILNVHHPDILKFITCKADSTEINNFNISVGITDAFMEAAKNNAEYELINPRNKKVVRKLSARVVFETMAKLAWKNGDPGFVCLDRLNAFPTNPTQHIGEIVATNPCVTADTWTVTAEGPRQVSDLIGQEFNAVVNGEEWSSGVEGFFETGVKPVLKLSTTEGFELRLTENHPVLKVRDSPVNNVVTEWITASNLHPEDKIVLHNHRGFDESKLVKGKHGEGEGYLMGLLLGDGTIKKDKVVLSTWGSGGAASVRDLAFEYAKVLPHRSDFKGWVPVKGRDEYRLSLAYFKKMVEELGLTDGKAITPAMEQDLLFCKGLLKGLFDADGSVQGSQSKGVSVRLAQSDLEMLRAVQRILLRFGIVSRVYMNRRDAGTSLLPDGKGGMKEYSTKAQHELIVSKENLVYFFERIGFGDSDKLTRLERAIANYKRSMNRESFVVTVESLVSDGIEPVYDVQVPGVNAFDANGLYVHNCGEQPLLPYEACNLGSVNVAKHTKQAEGKIVIDWDRLRETIRLGTRFLDNVVDMNKYPLV